MIVYWQVDDGYFSGSRPQATKIDDDELSELETEEEKEKFIDEAIQDDFDQKITWHKIT